MAGRGRRLGGKIEAQSAVRRPGAPLASPAEDTISGFSGLMKKIEDINPKDINPDAVYEIENKFKVICTSEALLRDVLFYLHKLSLVDCSFGEKVAAVMESLINLEIDGVLVRSELLKFVHNDYKTRDAIAKSDSNKLVNAVTFLGWLYEKLRVAGNPINILGVGLLDYLDLLLNGDENQLKTLTTQIFLNGIRLQKDEKLEKYEQLKHNLRKTLVTKNLSHTSKCWVLLAIDFMSNNLKPLQGVVRDFHLGILSESYLYLESLIPKEVKMKSVVSVVCPDNPQPKGKEVSARPRLVGEFEKINLDLVMGIKADVNHVREKMRASGLIAGGKDLKGKEDRKYRRWQEGEKLSDDEKVWGLNEKNKQPIGHDDRFQKDDDFYGIQMPRSTRDRPGKQNDVKRGSDTGLSRVKESQQSTSAEEHWN